MGGKYSLSNTFLGSELGWWYETYDEFYDSYEINYEYYESDDNYEIIYFI